MDESTFLLPQREVIVGDAVAWLEQNPSRLHASVVASLPDISEFPGSSLSEWQHWFKNVASLALSCAPPEGVCIFYQSDIKRDGLWVDKASLCLQAASEKQIPLLWHKIACRVPPGQASFGRPGYTHVLCFSRDVRPDVARSTADVIPDLGEKTWERGMGLEVCRVIGRFIKEQTTTSLVIQPFCGQGAMLAVANALGLPALGIERSPKRAAAAMRLQVDLERSVWLDAAAPSGAI